MIIIFQAPFMFILCVKEKPVVAELQRIMLTRQQQQQQQ